MIWYFDGFGGCELCQSNSAYTVEEPVDPHPNCHCGIEEVEPEEEAVDCEFEIREATFDFPTIYTIEETIAIDLCDTEGNQEGEIDLPEEFTDDILEFDDGLEEAVTAAGWEEPDIADPPSLSLIGPKIWLITVEVERTVQEFEGEVWLVCDIDGEHIESEVGIKTGHMERLTSFEIVGAEEEGCPDWA